jgi:tRNA(adenine34) deaminase
MGQRPAKDAACQVSTPSGGTVDPTTDQPFDQREADLRFMRAAIDEAMAAWEEDEVPIGAVVVHAGRIIGRGHNQRERLQDPTAHAEILAITAAAAHLTSWRLEECTLYVTLEPCPMCAGAIVQARIPRLVFGTPDPKAGACTTLYQITTDPRLNHRVTLGDMVLREECAGLLTGFFSEQRAKGKK